MSRNSPPEPASSLGDVLGAIDVGTNAVRLELAQLQADGSLEALHEERDPVRPGEGLFTSGSIPPHVVDRLVATLKRYSALCRRFHAEVRAVATSAVREAKNRDDIVRRVQKEARLNLEVISGKEEARLISLGVLKGKPSGEANVCLDIGGGSTEIAWAIGETPHELLSVPLGSVRLTEMFEASERVSKQKLQLMRHFTAEAFRDALTKGAAKRLPKALGSSGTIQAVVAFASMGAGHASLAQISQAVETLAGMGIEKRRKAFDARRADIVVSGAIILEAAMQKLRLRSIGSVPQGLRDGLLVDLVRRRKLDPRDHSLFDAAVAMGRRFGFDEPHARQVTRLALQLFDELASLHQLPAIVRQYLEAASLLHDVGCAVNYQRHHKHTYYLIQQADIPGLSDRERELVARMARYHRRTAPHFDHSGMQGLSRTEARWVRKASTLLRMADSLDKSHLQPIKRLSVHLKARQVELKMKATQEVDLETWDLAHEAPIFQEVFGKRLMVAGN